MNPLIYFAKSSIGNVQKKPWYVFLFSIVLGTAFLALLSPITITLPYTEIPLTLQSFGVFLLVLLQQRFSAVSSVLLYLLLATCGLPILAGAKSDSNWMIHPSGGYLFGFLCAAYITATIFKQKKQNGSNVIWSFFSLSIGLISLLIIGATWLGFFVGFEHAIDLGVKPFWIGGLIKNVAAVVCASLLQRVKHYLQ